MVKSWITFYHKLSGHDKRLMNYFMKIALLKDTNT